MNEETTAYLLYGSPEIEPNLLYWGRFLAPDAFWAFRKKDKTIAIVSTLEYGRCLKNSRFDEVLLHSSLLEAAQEAIKNKAILQKDPVAALFYSVCRRYGIELLVVPETFPVSLYQSLKKVVRVSVDTSVFSTLRKIKGCEEVNFLKEACGITSKCLSLARQILEASRIDKNGFLRFEKEKLTSARLRAYIEIECLKQGALAQHTIVACGQQATEPHNQGEGPLKAHSLIVVDIFPRVRATGYFGDMTRTFLKGEPSEAQKKLFDCVYSCQIEVLSQIKPEVTGSSLYNFAKDYFQKNGYPFKQHADGAEGFIHSLGHGVGLGLHEWPFLGPKGPVLEEGMVFTVEPGLYYRELGGVRIEDVVCVTKNGYELLSHCPYDWILD